MMMIMVVVVVTVIGCVQSGRLSWRYNRRPNPLGNERRTLSDGQHLDFG